MTDRAWLRDLVTALLALWITSGEYLDGWAHIHGFTDDTFFTRWHAWLYAGLVAFGAWMAIIVVSLARQRRKQGRPWRGMMRELPHGYRGAIIGLAIFVFGAPLDFIWHSAFGFERSIEALLSPPHILLLFGWLLMVSTAWRSQRKLSARGSLPEIISFASLVTLVAFFVAYKSPFRRAAVLSSYENVGDDLASEWVAALLVTTVVLIVPLLWQIRDGRYRVGTLTSFVAGVGLGGSLGVSENWSLVTLLIGAAGAVAGALVAELLYARLQPVWSKWTYNLPIVMAGMTFLIWAGLYIGYSLSDPIQWPIAVWGGTLLLASAMAAVLGAVAWRPPSRSLFNGVSAAAALDLGPVPATAPLLNIQRKNVPSHLSS